MLTTIDNPFDPMTDWDSWRLFDEQQGYYTCAYLDRVAYTSEELSEKDNDLAIQTAIDEIVAFNVNGKYKKLEYDSDNKLITP